MAYGNNEHVTSGKATAAVSAFRFVKRGTADDEIAESDANEVVVGIGPDYALSAAEMGFYASGGVSQVQCGGTVTRGDRLKADADGKAVTIASSGTTIQNVGGIALRSGVDGDVIPAQVEIYSERPALV